MFLTRKLQLLPMFEDEKVDMATLVIFLGLLASCHGIPLLRIVDQSNMTLRERLAAYLSNNEQFSLLMPLQTPPMECLLQPQIDIEVVVDRTNTMFQQKDDYAWQSTVRFIREIAQAIQKNPTTDARIGITYFGQDVYPSFPATWNFEDILLNTEIIANNCFERRCEPSDEISDMAMAYFKATKKLIHTEADASERQKVIIYIGSGFHSVQANIFEKVCGYMPFDCAPSCKSEIITDYICVENAIKQSIFQGIETMVIEVDPHDEDQEQRSKWLKANAISKPYNFFHVGTFMELLDQHRIGDILGAIACQNIDELPVADTRSSVCRCDCRKDLSHHDNTEYATRCYRKFVQERNKEQERQTRANTPGRARKDRAIGEIKKALNQHDFIVQSKLKANKASIQTKGKRVLKATETSSERHGRKLTTQPSNATESIPAMVFFQNLSNGLPSGWPPLPPRRSIQGHKYKVEAQVVKQHRKKLRRKKKLETLIGLMRMKFVGSMHMKVDGMLKKHIKPINTSKLMADHAKEEMKKLEYENRNPFDDLGEWMKIFGRTEFQVDASIPQIPEPLDEDEEAFDVKTYRDKAQQKWNKFLQNTKDFGSHMKTAGGVLKYVAPNINFDFISRPDFNASEVQETTGKGTIYKPKTNGATRTKNEVLMLIVISSLAMLRLL